MYELTITNMSGETLNLSTSNKYTVYKIEGLAPPQATINSSVNATEDGSIVNSTRVESRNLVIYLTIDGDVEANRIALYKYFTSKNRVKINYKNGARDVYIEGIVELVECDLFTNRETAQISIICPSPYFRGINDLVSNFSDISSLFEFPFSIAESGVELSDITPNIRKSILYTGDVETGTIIEIFANGTVVNPTLYDVNNRTHMSLKLSLSPTDKIVINTMVGHKSILLYKDGQTYNALGYMSPDSDWFTLKAGDNVFTYECQSGSSNIEISFKTPLLYGGV